MESKSAAPVRYEKEIPVIGEYDVAVIGGGPSGVCAAVEAARDGASVILIETYGMLGGMATTALVSPFMTCYDRDGNVPVVRGLFEEIVRRAEEKGGAFAPAGIEAPSIYTSFIAGYHRHVTPFDAFTLQVVLDELTREAGVKVLLYTKFCDAVTEDGKITAAILAAEQGTVAVRAETFIDCTGNASVAAASGVETWKGREDGQPPQPGTLMFEVEGAVDELYDKRPPKPVKAYRLPTHGHYKVNHYRVHGVDAADSESMTEGHTEARKQVLQAYEVLRGQPGFEAIRLSQVASVLGVRESRHIRGEYRLTVADVTDPHPFEDSVCVFGYGLDIHPRDPSQKGNFKIQVAPMYEIPFRCLVPVGVRNLLVAGKTISAESDTAGSFRVMPAAMALGQAAGAAAALAKRDGILPRDVPASELRALLRAHGALVSMSDCK